MGFINKLKSFFFNEQEIGIINIGDLLQIPGRDYFKNNNRALALIDKYKEDYFNILKTKRTIYSKDLSLDDLQNGMLMNIDLVLSIVDKRDSLYDEIKKTKFKNMVDMIKLKLYLNTIEEMEMETIIRLIALKELEKGRKVPHTNRNALKEEINILTTNLIIFINQKRAINIETNTYLANIVIDDNGNEDTDEELSSLIKLANVYLNVDDVVKMDIKTEIKIAIIERRLEIYCYKHKDEIIRLTKEVNDLDNTDLSFTHLKKEDFLRIITDLETKYEIFRRYGINVVTREHLYNLYRVKFDIITNVLKYYPIYTYIGNEIEREIYEDIIFRKKEKILKGENENVKIIFGNNEKKAIKLLSSLFQEDSFETYSPIHTSAKVLELLLTFDDNSGHSFKHFYDTPIDTPSYMKQIDNYFTWQDEIPLSSLMEFMNPVSADNHYISRSYKNKYLYNLYYLSYLNKKYKWRYQLPKGLASIDIPPVEDSHIITDRLLHPYLIKIRKEANAKEVYFPDSLVHIKGDLFDTTKILGIHFNSGLKSISRTCLEPQNQDSINIPATLEYVGKGSIDLSNTKKIYFHNLYEDRLLTSKNKESLCYLLHTAFMGVDYNTYSNFGKMRITTTNNQQIIISGYKCAEHTIIELEKLCKDVVISRNKNNILYNPHTKQSDDINFYKLNPIDIRIVINRLMDEINQIKETKKKLVRHKF